MPSIATRTGDDGTTSLLYGQRVPKDHPQIEAVGALDELNVALGAVKPLLGAEARDAAVRALVTAIQKNLVALMGEVACAEGDVARHAASKFERISIEDVRRLDVELAALEARGLKFDGWATPGANARAAAFELARTAARRAERRMSALPAHGRNLRPELRHFINRLSDLIWLLAREAEQ
ncbi:MAG TPA: cob(I)yrinic acid a,c-diamide adenosyltransferase [Opitutaceae bacterium]|nr:cob(I)yrinic acid a,c-diamide adenosyltransferase [Opitutaceae bacterium]